MFTRLPSLNAIRTFESAARLGSFKRAADELNVSDTAVSHQIRSLEKQLNVRLFVRHTRRVALTEAGADLSRVSTSLFNQLNEAIRAMTTQAASVHITTTQAFAAMWLVPQLPDFRGKFPGIDIQISADDRILDLDGECNADLSIRYGHYRPQNNALPLIRESLGCYASPNYLNRADQKRRTHVFMTTRWKNPRLPETELRRVLASSDLGHPFEIREYEDENQILHAALTGQGVAILSQLLVQPAVKEGWIEECFPDLSARLIGLDYYVVFPARRRGSESVDAVVNWLVERLPQTTLNTEWRA